MTKYFHSHNFVFELSRQNLKLAPILKFLPNVKQSIVVSTPEQLKKLLKYLGTTGSPHIVRFHFVRFTLCAATLLSI